MKEFSSSFSCCIYQKDRKSFSHILEEFNLTPTQKQIIFTRYISLIESFRKRAQCYHFLFYIGHFIVTVGSLFVPALLSIINSDKTITNNDPRFTVQIYWSTFIISLMVTICNGILTLFRIDKKYYSLHTSLERLRSEGWQYFGLTGRYSGHLLGNEPPSHKNQFVYFTHYVEKLKLKQVEEEYYKVDDKTQDVAQSANGRASDLYPPSPDQAITSMISIIPDPVKDAVNSIIKSHKTLDTIVEEVRPITESLNNVLSH